MAFDVAKYENPLEVADRLGRPVAILRIGGRVPGPEGPDNEFMFNSPPWQPFQRRSRGPAPGRHAARGTALHRNRATKAVIRWSVVGCRSDHRPPTTDHLPMTCSADSFCSRCLRGATIALATLILCSCRVPISNGPPPVSPASRRRSACLFHSRSLATAPPPLPCPKSARSHTINHATPAAVASMAMASAGIWRRLRRHGRLPARTVGAARPRMPLALR